MATNRCNLLHTILHVAQPPIGKLIFLLLFTGYHVGPEVEQILDQACGKLLGCAHGYMYLPVRRLSGSLADVTFLL